MLSVKFRYNSHTIKFTLLKYIIQWLLVYSQLCAINITNSKTFSSAQKETPTRQQSLPVPTFPQLLATTPLLNGITVCERCWGGFFVFFFLSFTDNSNVQPKQRNINR